MKVRAFFDTRTCTLTYVIWDEESGKAAVIDPVLDYDPVAARVFNESIDEVLAFVDENGLTLDWVLETHAHADHISASQYIKKRTGAAIVVSAHITAVQEVFRDALNLGEDLATDGSQFDRLVKQGDTLPLGGLSIGVIETPGHTPACTSYQVQDAVFTGDAMFMPDFGTGRCDFPGGSAETLYDSVVNRLYTLPDSTRLFVGHDYQPGGRELEYQTTVGEAKKGNIQLRGDTAKEQFVEWRSARDATLKLPKLIFQAIQINVNAGRLPRPESNGKRYLKLPLNLFD